MKKAYLDRRSSSLQGTLGTFAIPSVMFSCYSLELPWKYNQTDISCVPDGIYRVVFEYSEHFKGRRYELKDVPERSECKFHKGNFAGSVEHGFKSDVKGCTLLGMLPGEIDGQIAVLHSESAFLELNRRLAGESFELQIKWSL